MVRFSSQPSRATTNYRKKGLRRGEQVARIWTSNPSCLIGELPLGLSMKAVRRRWANLRPLMAFCLSVLFASAVALGAVPGDSLASSLSTYAFLAAVGALLAANLLTIFLPSRSGAEDDSD